VQVRARLRFLVVGARAWTGPEPVAEGAAGGEATGRTGKPGRLGRHRATRARGRYASPVLVRLESTYRSITDRIRQEVRELGKFGVIGAIAWIVDTLVFNASLSWLDGAWAPAAVISTTVSATVAFIGNRFWTWRHRARSSLRREYLLYAIFNVIGLLISLTCLFLSHKVLGEWWPGVFHTRLADNIAKQGFGLLLGTAFRFWSYRRYVFVAIEPPRVAPPEPQPDPVD
jgi:putative flippase GtrA